ncbi:LysR family transcriptional regulator [Niveispirillum sp. SYP-B3756]|nr:LysR family transcriptional regulator [Niveispirillum sp. SYP-B3756]
MAPMDERLEIANAVSMMSFAAVVSTGSFSAAADALGYSKAAVSRQISQLEARIGLRLLERTTRSIALTPAGREIYSRCSRILDEVKEANDLLAGIQATPRGDLRVRAPVVASLFRITEMIPKFLEMYPQIKFHLDLTDSKIDLIKGDFDLAFWTGDTYDSTLDSIKLWEYDMVVAGAREYFAKAGVPRTPAEIKDHACIMETHLSRPGEWALSQEHVIQLQGVRLVSNSVRVTREALLAGMGIAFLPRFLIEQDLAAGRLEMVLNGHVTTKLPLYLVYAKGNYVLAKVKAFVDFMSQSLNEGEIVPEFCDEF